MAIISFNLCFFFLQDESARTTLRRTYHSWSQRRQEAGQPWSWDEYMQALLAKVKDMEDKEDSDEDEDDVPFPGGASSKETKEDQDTQIDAPTYRDGMLKQEFWQDHWNVFRQCQNCQEFKYVNRQHTMRAVGCRNCMGEGCQASKPSRKVNLLRQLKKVHGEEIYKEYLVDI